MKIRVPDYFKNFKCIASECEDTCCAGWEIVIDDRAYEKYQNVEGEFGEHLRSKIVMDEGDRIFKMRGNDCPFLNEEKLCDIYSEIGEEGLCHTCTQYPRYTEEFGNLKEVGLSLSCPEAARIMLRDSEKVSFEINEVDEEPSFNDIDGMLFLFLLQCRKVAMNISQNREIDINTRASILLQFGGEIQSCIDEDRISEIKGIKEKYADDSFLQDLVATLKNSEDRTGERYLLIEEYFKVFKELKHINTEDPLKLDEVLNLFWNDQESEEKYKQGKKAFREYYRDQQFRFENLLVYFLFRYFMKGVFDYDVLAKVKTSVISLIMMEELLFVRWLEMGELSFDDQVDIMHMYSKDVEHLDENIETLAHIFETNDSFKTDKMILTMMN